MTAKAFTGHQESWRNMTRAELDAALGIVTIVGRAPGAGSERPADYVPVKLPGVYYAGQWWPEGNPVGQQLEKLRYMLPAPVTASIGDCYDESCGMQDQADFAHELLMAVFDELLAYELEIVLQGGQMVTGVTWVLVEGFEAAAHIYLAAIGIHWLHNNSKRIMPNDMDAFRLRIDDFFGFRREPVKFVPQPAPVLPQALQDPKDVADLIAATAARLSIKQKREIVTPPTTKSQYPEAFQRVIDGKVVNCL